MIQKQMLQMPKATNDLTKSGLFYPRIRKIDNVVYKETLSGACCVKPAHAFITSSCLSHRIALTFAGVSHDIRFPVNKFADFLDVVQVTNEDFVQSLVEFGISNISYFGKNDFWHSDVK